MKTTKAKPTEAANAGDQTKSEPIRTEFKKGIKPDPFVGLRRRNFYVEKEAEDRA